MERGRGEGKRMKEERRGREKEGRSGRRVGVSGRGEGGRRGKTEEGGV